MQFNQSLGRQLTHPRIVKQGLLPHNCNVQHRLSHHDGKVDDFRQEASRKPRAQLLEMPASRDEQGSTSLGIALLSSLQTFDCFR
jgi:hypothetical protein